MCKVRLPTDLPIKVELRNLPSRGRRWLPRLAVQDRSGGAGPGAPRETRPGVRDVGDEGNYVPVIKVYAVEQLTERPRTHCTVLTTDRKAGHLGMLALYTEAATARDLFGSVLAIGKGLAHPYGGIEQIPGAKGCAVCIPTGSVPRGTDLEISHVSMCENHHHGLRSKPIPGDLAVEGQGRRTRGWNATKSDAIGLFDEGECYGLDLDADSLVAALTGPVFAPEVVDAMNATQVARNCDIFLLPTRQPAKALPPDWPPKLTDREALVPTTRRDRLTYAATERAPAGRRRWHGASNFRSNARRNPSAR